MRFMRALVALSCTLLVLLIALDLSSAHRGLMPVSAQGSPPEAYARVATWSPSPRQRAEGSFTEVSGVDAAEGSIYLVDRAEGYVQVLDETGSPIRRIGRRGRAVGQLYEPSDVAYWEGRLYVADQGNRRVQVFDAESGGFLASWDAVGTPRGIAAHEGLVYVTDAVLPRISVIDSAGVVQEVWGQAGQKALDLVSPQGIDVDDQGRVAVADPGRDLILMLTSDGVLSGELQPYDLEAADTRAADIAFYGQRLLVSTPYGIVLYQEGFLGLGDWQAFVADRGIGFAGVAVRPWDQGLVAAQNDHWAIASGLRYFAGPGVSGSSSTIDSLPVELGSLDGPRRIAASEDGGAYVADSWPRVQFWAPGGLPFSQFRADDLVDVVPAPAGDAFVIAGSAIRRQRSDGSQAWSWRSPDPESWFAAGEMLGGKLLVIDIGLGRLLSFEADLGGIGPSSSVPLDGQPVDMAAGGGYIFLADRAADALRLLDSTGRETQRWSPTGRVLRVAAPSDGSAFFALTEDGWIWKYDASGTLRAAWDGAPEGKPIDIDVNDAGGVLVADGGGDRIFVYAPDADGVAATPPNGAGCDLLADKVASPGRVATGSPVDITLSVSGGCPSESIPLDVMLVIDKSGSMVGPKMEAARSAAIDFTAELDFAQAQAGVLLFSSDVEVTQPLTTSASAIVRGVAKAEAFGGTNIADALDYALDELESPRARVGASRALVMLTDGKPEGGRDPVGRARASAAAARDAGLTLYTVGLGQDVDAALLSEIAGDPSRYFEAPRASELPEVYRQIARRLVSTTLLQSIEIEDVIPSNMQYVEGSASPAATWDGSTLRWSLRDVPPSGFQLTYQVVPQELGVWPTNVSAVGTYLDGVDVRGSVVFPVPTVDVYGSRVAYLPLLFQRACPETRSDIVLVIDTSTSMDQQSGAGGSTKLDAAKAAARAFLGFVDLPRDRAAVVGFNREATVVQGITGDHDALVASLDRLPREPGTHIDEGLAAARMLLADPGRGRANLPVVVLLTDGRPAPDTEAAVRAETLALREEGFFVFTIGLGADADGGLLIEIAGQPERYSYAPDQNALSSIYQTIAWSLPCQ